MVVIAYQQRAFYTRKHSYVSINSINDRGPNSYHKPLNSQQTTHLVALGPIQTLTTQLFSYSYEKSP